MSRTVLTVLSVLKPESLFCGSLVSAKHASLPKSDWKRSRVLSSVLVHLYLVSTDISKKRTTHTHISESLASLCDTTNLLVIFVLKGTSKGPLLVVILLVIIVLCVCLVCRL